jgi:hypothetical protein
MKKTLLVALMLSMSSLVHAKEVDYGSYSDEYDKCIQKISFNTSDFQVVAAQVRKCQKDEYNTITTEIEKQKQAIARITNFSEYNNNKEISLSNNIDGYNEYIETYCNVIAAIQKERDSFEKCQFDEIQNLFVDLYKLQKSVATR